MTYYSLEFIGGNNGNRNLDVRTSRGANAGIIAWNGNKGFARVYWNLSATRGSARKFPSIDAALEYIHARREKRGMNAAR